MRSLPACLTKFDAADFVESSCKPKRYYDVILSRPRHAAEVAPGVVGVWSRVSPVRCLLTRDGIEARLSAGFFVCILREFDELPQVMG